MKIQGSSEEEQGVQITTQEGPIDLPNLYSTLKQFFAMGREIVTFDVLEANLKGGTWKIKLFIEHKQLVRTINLTTNLQGKIQRFREEIRNATS